jgi:hypothetical protein
MIEEEITRVSQSARRGSSLPNEPGAKKLRGGTILSLATACKTRGAPRNDPRALESVAAKTPAGFQPKGAEEFLAGIHEKFILTLIVFEPFSRQAIGGAVYFNQQAAIVAE